MCGCSIHEQIGGLNFEKGFRDKLTEQEFKLLDSFRFSNQAGADFDFLSKESAVLSPDLRKENPTFERDLLNLEQRKLERSIRKAKQRSGGFGGFVSGLTGGDPRGKATKRIQDALAKLENIYGKLGKATEFESIRTARLAELDPEFRPQGSRGSENEAKALNELLIAKAGSDTGLETARVSDALKANSGIQIPT